MASNPVAKIAVSFKLTNGRIVTIHEGDIVEGLMYKNGNDLNCVNGMIRVINGSTKKHAVTQSMLPEPYISDMLSIVSIVVDMSDEFDAELVTIPINNIMDITAVRENEGAVKIGIGSQYNSLTDVIDNAPDGSVIELLAGTYEMDITLNKSIKIVSENGAIINGNINIIAPSNTRSVDGDGINVVLDGLYLTGNSKIRTEGVSSFTMTNCAYLGHNFAEKTNPIIINMSDMSPVKVNIDDNVFGKENGNCYNTIEVYGKLKNGSTFNGNRFDTDCCTHNQISLYNIEDGAIVEINDNHCAVSKNMVRIGFMGNPNAIVEMRDNVYVESDVDNPEWSGLFLVQPYGTRTESFEDLTIMVYNINKAAGQLCYLYAGASDTQFNDTNKPTIMVDGKKIVPVVLS